MSILSRLFRRVSSPTADAAETDPLVPVFMPERGVLLVAFEKKKGAPLSESEALEVRDGAVCIALPRSRQREIDEKRGYRDLDPHNLWPEWLEYRARVTDVDSPAGPDAP